MGRCIIYVRGDYNGAIYPITNTASISFSKIVLHYVCLYGDRGYRGCEGVIVCDSREMRAKRQVVEGVISQIKLFNAGSGWRTLTCVLVYTYAYAIGYSYYRRGELEA